MNAILGRPKTPDLENRVNTPPTQTGSSSGSNLPPAVRPTYQGPDGDNDPLEHTIPLVPGMHPQVPSQEGYSSQGKPHTLYDSRN